MKDSECFPCDAVCRECTEARCVRCHGADSVLLDGGCVDFHAVEHCTRADVGGERRVKTASRLKCFLSFGNGRPPTSCDRTFCPQGQHAQK